MINLVNNHDKKKLEESFKDIFDFLNIKLQKSPPDIRVRDIIKTPL
jgi:hypothetical protein